MRAGRKNRRIRIEVLTTLKSTYGTDTETWSLQKEVWADAMPVKGDERPGNAQLTSESFMDFKIDYIAGLSPKTHRIRFEGNVYDILWIHEEGAYREALRLTTKAQPAGGVGAPIAGSVQLASPISPAELTRGAQVSIGTVEANTITLYSYSEYEFTIDQLHNLRVSAGSCTVTLYLNGVAITGLSNLSVTTTAQHPLATAGNEVTVGDRITMQISNVAGAADLEFSMKGTL